MQQFNGLTMPVFTAFGWGGEEKALNFAFSQLEEFIRQLQANLPRTAQIHFPFSGLDKASRMVYLAANGETAQDFYIAFVVRPSSLEMILTLTNKMVLNKALKSIGTDPDKWLELMQGLEPAWSLHIPQMEYNEETEEATFYQDVYKDTVAAMTPEKAKEVGERTVFLNTEPKWLATFQFSQRIPAEQASTMGAAIIDIMAKRINNLLPLLSFFGRKIGSTGTQSTKKKKAKKAKTSSTTTTTSASVTESVTSSDRFVYTTTLKPLHIRKGFINLTAEHWPFFAINARTTTRPISISYDMNKTDKDSSVWRLVSSDVARLVLGPSAHLWLQNNFDANDAVQVIATKVNPKEIEVFIDSAD